MNEQKSRFNFQDMPSLVEDLQKQFVVPVVSTGSVFSYLGNSTNTRPVLLLRTTEKAVSWEMVKPYIVKKLDEMCRELQNDSFSVNAIGVESVGLTDAELLPIDGDIHSLVYKLVLKCYVSVRNHNTYKFTKNGAIY